MRTTFKYFITFCILFQITEAQERVLLRIRDGKQESYSMQKGESAKNAIERIENEPAEYVEQATGLFDTLKYYPGLAKAATGTLNTNFGFNHQDVALQWYSPINGGNVIEFWWYNLQNRGNINKGTIRAWYVNPKLAALPSSYLTKAIGYYKDSLDNDGNATAFKPVTGDQWFYKTSGADSSVFDFDPLGTEAPWRLGGLQVTLDSSKWQGIKLKDSGMDFPVNFNQHFGFTLMNDTKASDTGSIDMRMEIGSIDASSSPFHSLKFYEDGRFSPADKGWWLRGDYEWGMYVVVNYTTDPYPRIQTGIYQTTLSTLPRKICATVLDDNPGGGPSGIADVSLFYKIGSLAKYDSVQMVFSETSPGYCAYIPQTQPGDTVYWYIRAIDINDNVATTPSRSYRIFKQYNSLLFLYNNAQHFANYAKLIYTGSYSQCDSWSAPDDGISELDELLSLYNNVVLADGSFPSRDVYPAIAGWLASGTSGSKKNLFFTSQDYGCMITEDCADTTFEAGSWEYDYLGIRTLGPQDIPPTNREYRMKPTTHSMSQYLLEWENDSGSTLWYNPTFELAFAGYPDGIVPTAAAETLFTNDNGTIVHGIIVNGATFRTAFFSFDVAALEFRSDTAIAPGSDPKYWWIGDVRVLVDGFFVVIEKVESEINSIPNSFSLSQNFPNPFNPITTFKYTVPVRNTVEIAIYNILGQKVATLVNDSHEVGQHRITWNGKDGSGKPVASGIYFYQMKAGSFQSVKKMILMK